MFTRNTRTAAVARTLTAAAAALCALGIAVAPAFAGAIGGPKERVTSVAADGSDTYFVSFYGGEVAEVGATAPGEDIDLYIYDEDGRLVARDTLDDDTPVCRWYPSRTQRYRIKVVNCESYRVRYGILTN